MKRIRKHAILILLLGLALFCFSGAVYAEENKGFALAQELQDFFINWAEQVKSVVVAVEPLPQPKQEITDIPPDSPDESDKPPDDKKGGNGSGAIITADGYIVSNYHVVGVNDKMKIILSDNREFIAKIIGRDPDTDLALMKIDAKTELPFALLGNSDEIKIGQWVLAIGKPFGLKGTTTFGIISGLDRNEVGLNQFENFIQIDAAINPGNSGGPSFNIKGELIGINTGVMNMADNIGFMIPVNMVKEVIGQLQRTGRVARGLLGVGIQELTPELAKKFNWDSAKGGVLVAEAYIGQPADQVGIKYGDIILKVEDVPIETPKQLSKTIAGFKPGAIIKMEIAREGQIMKFSLTLADRNDMKE